MQITKMQTEDSVKIHFCSGEMEFLCEITSIYNCQQRLLNVLLLLNLSRFSGHSDLNVMDTKGNLTYTGAAHSGKFRCF